MIDIDYFKRLNDRDGHVAGDACLRSLGKVLAAAIRQHSDLAARYGGEEFALLLPGADLEAAMRVATRLRATVENLRIPHLASPAGQVTISIGVASFRPRPGATPQESDRSRRRRPLRCQARGSQQGSGRSTLIADGRRGLIEMT